MRPAVEIRGADISPSQEASFWSLVRRVYQFHHPGRGGSGSGVDPR